MWQRIALLSGLLAVGLAEYLDDTYFVMVPKVMRPGQPLQISATYTYYRDVGQATVIVDLVEKDTGSQVTSESYTMPPADCGSGFTGGCPVSRVLSFQVPESKDLPTGEYNITVRGDYDGSSFQNSTTVKVKRKTVSILVQTDRAMYKPSQTIKFRVLAVDANLLPVDTKLNISIHDPADNKIKQWLNVQLVEGLISNKLELSEQPPLGDWCIQVAGQDTGMKKCVEIAEYVLPKYEVTMDAPSYFLTSSEKLTATVGAKYTYGQPVRGSCIIKVQIKPYPYYDSSDYTQIVINKTLANGKADFDVPMVQLLRIVPTYRWTTWSEEWATQQLSYREILFMAECTETLTGKSFSKNATTIVRKNKFNMEFMDITSDNYKPGLNYSIYLQLTLPDGSPPSASDLVFPNGTAMTIKVRDRQRYYYNRAGEEEPEANWTLTVDNKGMAYTSFSVPVNLTYLDLSAFFNDGNQQVTAYRYVNPFKSRDNQGIQISFQDSTGQIKRQDDVKFLISTSEETDRAYLQLMSKGSLVASYVITYPSMSMSQIFTVTMTDELTRKLAPSGRAIVCYTTSNDEVVCDSVDFNVEGAFANEVSIGFNATVAKPADVVSVTVSAFPQSYVGLMAVDQSVLLLATGNDLSQDEVIEELKSYDSTNTQDDYFGGPGRMWRKKRRSMCWMCFPSTGGKDTKEVLDNAGVRVMTDRFIYVEPPPQYYYRGRGGLGERGRVGAAMPDGRAMESAPAPAPAPARGPAGPAGAPGSSNSQSASSLKEVTRVRTSFPETWLWTEEHAGEDGTVNINTVVPDTITSWVASAFAMSPVKGLGITDTTAEINVFKSFFVSLDLPYSIIRGEEVSMKIVVFNYLSTDLQVLVTLEKSWDFAIKKANEVDYRHAKAQATLTVPAGDGATINMWMEPRVLGNIPIEVKAQSTLAADGVRRMLLVEPEGAPQEYNTNFLVDLTEQSSFTDEVELSLPDEGLVPGSVRITASAIGDIMGPSMNGLDHLVKMPSGCGEQNMLNFAPNIFVMDYLTASGKVDPELSEKAIGYMEKGYQRELTYQHYDGSFSAFGNSDPSGSTWLTAFVVKSFCEAKEYISIDSEKVLVGLKWILETQESDGHFREPGRVIHTEMQGGAASGITLTGYVTVTLLEACHVDDEEGLRADVDYSIDLAIQYLLEQYDRGTYTSDPYTMAIVSYALATKGHSRAQELMDALDRMSIEESGMKHWSKQEEDNSIKTYEYEDRVVFAPPRRQATASEIETTAYSLLTFVKMNDISYGIPVMKWLVSQRNSLGGYSSTQDTVMALQSLATYASAASGDSVQDIEIVLEAGGVEYRFPSRISSVNSVILQQIDVTDAMYRTMTVRGSGNGIALVQVSVQYNVDNVYEDPGMNLEVTSQEITEGLVHVEVCGWYTGDEPSGMVGLEVNPLSGFVATNLDDLRNSVRELSRVEMSGKKYMFYFNQMTADKICVTLHMERVNIIANVKKALVTSYKYYEPTVRRTKFYMPRDFLGQDVCASCPECCADGGIIIDLTDISDVIDGEMDHTKPTQKHDVFYGGHTRHPNGGWTQHPNGGWTRHPNGVWTRHPNGDWTGGAASVLPFMSLLLMAVGMATAARFM